MAHYIPRYILICCVEREIYEPKFFNNLVEANSEMIKEFTEALGFPKGHFFTKEELEDLENDNVKLTVTSAYCENLNHDNCDWKIFEI